MEVIALPDLLIQSVTTTECRSVYRSLVCHTRCICRSEHPLSQKLTGISDMHTYMYFIIYDLKKDVENNLAVVLNNMDWAWF